tara:strand:+ start:597 stop:1019 length:423 start_codon:yes stop_codon:yes gene_type:complete
MLLRRTWDLHPTCAPDGGVGHIAIAGDLVRCVYDHHPFTDLIRKHASNLAQHRRLANARPSQQKHALTGANQIVDDPNAPKDCSSDTTGNANRTAAAISDNRNPVKGSFNPGPIVVAELADALNDPLQVGVGDFLLTQSE